MSIFVRLRKLAINAYRSLPGRPFAATLARADRNFRRWRGNRIVVEEHSGFMMELDLSQMIDSHIYYNGTFEPETIEAFKELVTPGMIILDIGANVGSHTLHLAEMTGDAGHVFAFEPTQWAFKKLQRNVSLNPRLTHVTAERVALADWDAAGADYAFRSQYLLDGDPDGTPETGQVDYVTLDTYCRSKAIDRIDFIKLDVDGYETKILRGAKDTLTRFRPTLIVEMGDYWQRQAGDSIEALVGILDGLGYRYERQEDFSPIDDIVSDIKALDEKWAVNVICRPA